MKTAKSIFLFFLSLLLSMASLAQDTAKHISGTSIPQQGISTPKPTYPRYPGGSDSLVAFIKKNVHYPETAKKYNVTGIVVVGFVVAADGSIKNPKVLKPLGHGCDEEALRIVNLMPKWIPATNGTEPIQINNHVNIHFGIQ